MKKCWINFFILCALSFLLSSCAFYSQSQMTKTTKNMEYVAILDDPMVRKDFRALVTTARRAHTYKQNGNIYLDPQDVKYMDALSSQIIGIMYYQYHLNPQAMKIHTYVGKNQYNSCYQYYNSMAHDSVGQSCDQFSTGFSSCRLCNQFISKVRARSSAHIVHAQWWANENTTALVETIELRNHDTAYVGLELSTDD